MADPIHEYDGNPNGVILAIPGLRYRDINTGKIYKPTGPTSGTAWIEDTTAIEWAGPSGANVIAAIQTHAGGGGPHANNHAALGSDPITIAQSQVTNLTSDLAGKAASSHNHDGTYAAAAHNHDSAYASKDLFARITGSNATTTGQSLVNVTGLSLALDANSVYQFEAVLMVQSSSTAGNAYGVNFSAAGATVEAQITGTLAAATQKTLRISALNTAATPFVTSGATGGIYIAGMITVGANAGNLTIQHYKVTSGTSTVFINSFTTAIKRA